MRMIVLLDTGAVYEGVRSCDRPGEVISQALAGSEFFHRCWKLLGGFHPTAGRIGATCGISIVENDSGKRRRESQNVPRYDRDVLDVIPAVASTKMKMLKNCWRWGLEFGISGGASHRSSSGPQGRGKRDPVAHQRIDRRLWQA